MRSGWIARFVRFPTSKPSFMNESSLRSGKRAQSIRFSTKCCSNYAVNLSISAIINKHLKKRTTDPSQIHNRSTTNPQQIHNRSTTDPPQIHI